MRLALVLMLPAVVQGYWEPVSTLPPTKEPPAPVKYTRYAYPKWNKYSWNMTMEMRAATQTYFTCGISYQLDNLSTATLISNRMLVTAANFLDPYLDDVKDLRVYCYDRWGEPDRPQRYRVWRVVRVLPKSSNPEHSVTRFGLHHPRHDVAIVYTQDVIFSVTSIPVDHAQPTIVRLPEKLEKLSRGRCRMNGIGFASKEELRTFFRIRYHLLEPNDIVDCSAYLPKYWGKHICFKNVDVLYGINNGAGLFCGKWDKTKLFGVGAFEIRYNEERILVFTDLRYYVDRIEEMINELKPFEYYEYAMQEYYDVHKKKSDLYDELMEPTTKRSWWSWLFG